jgi:hypothetical protein
MTIGEARLMLRSAIRDGESSDQFEDSDLDYAIQYAGNYFCRVTHAIKRVAQVVVTAEQAELDLTTILAEGFTPERLIAAYIPGQEEMLSVADVMNFESLRAVNNVTGNPQYLSFTDVDTAELFPHHQPQLSRRSSGSCHSLTGTQGR